MTSPTAIPLLQSVEELAPLIREQADGAERERHLSPPVFEAMVDAGLLRMFVPHALDGLEVSVVEGFEVIEKVSEIDSAAGWNLQIAAIGGPISAALLPDEGAREIFSDPRAVIAGGFNPPGAAVPVEGGYRLSGRWPFASACLHANWFIDMAMVMKDGQPLMGEQGQPVLIAPIYHANEGTIVETWDPLGMRGTGSHDIVADGVFVPTTRAAPMRPFDDVGRAFQGPLYKLGLMPVILGNAVVALGIARAAIDEAVDLTKTRVSAFNQPVPASRGVVHSHLARAEAQLSSARAYFYGALDDAWKSALAGNRPNPRQRIHLQLAASHAVEASAASVDHIHASVGSSGMREEQHRFAQHFRDVHTITQHATCSEARYESIGQVMLGQETDWAFLWF